ncbi:MAG: OmpA family protein [Polyangiales bacterium]
MLAAQFIPFAAYAQQNPPASSSEDDEEEEEAPAANPAPSESGGSGASETPAEPSAPATPESDEDRRIRMRARYSTLDGSIGLLRTASAQTGAAGSFRFGFTGEYFGASEFLRPPTLTGTAAVGGADSASHVGGTITLSYNPLDFLEIFGSIRAYANSNNRERPALFQVLGDSTLGVKGAFRVTTGLHLGLDAQVLLLNRSGDVGLLLDSTSAQFRALASLDLHEITGSVPLRFHLNVRYLLDNSAAVVTDTEQRRRAAAGVTAADCASSLANDPRCYIEVSRVERFALGVNRHDQVGINVGIDANLPYVNPFAEWSVGIPVNRQGYSCYDPGTSGAAPGGAADDDLCLGNPDVGFSSLPSRVTLGARVLPPINGLSAILAFDIATSGTSSFVRELAPTPPWQFFFGAAFAYDSHLQNQRIEVPGPERVVTREVDRTPPGGTVNGNVRDAESHSGINRAIVTFTGHPELHVLATAADGTFRSGHIPPGDYRVRVEAEGYQPNECAFTIAAPAAPAEPAPAAPGAPATAPAPAAAPTPPAPVTANCELRALPRRGGLQGHVTSSQGGAAVANATVTIAPAPGFSVPQGQQAPFEQTATTDEGGNFNLADLLAGPYLVSVGPTATHMGTTPQAVTVEPRQTANVNITARRRGAMAARLQGNLIVITRQVHFQTGSAQILPDSNTLLEDIADVIRRNSSISSVEIQGHTDNQGTPENNMTLSQQRADAVRERLVQLGVAADKLTARGFGQTRPIRPNLTVAGRAANRRVMFRVTRGAAGAP